MSFMVTEFDIIKVEPPTIKKLFYDVLQLKILVIPSKIDL